MIKIFLLFFFTSFCFSQHIQIEEKIIDSLLIRSINSRIDLALSKGEKYFDINEYTERIKSKINIPILKFYTNLELFDISIKSKEPISLITIYPKIISKDTIDINFGNITYKAKRGIFLKGGLHFKKILISLACETTLEAYQPDIRFIYCYETKKWKMTENIYNSYYQNY